jgi:hypothetical protein
MRSSRSRIDARRQLHNVSVGALKRLNRDGTATITLLQPGRLNRRSCLSVTVLSNRYRFSSGCFEISIPKFGQLIQLLDMKRAALLTIISSDSRHTDASVFRFATNLMLDDNGSDSSR